MPKFLLTAWMTIYLYQDIMADVTKMTKALRQKKKKQEQTKRGSVICMDDTVDDGMEVNIRISPSKSTTHAWNDERIKEKTRGDGGGLQIVIYSENNYE